MQSKIERSLQIFSSESADLVAFRVISTLRFIKFLIQTVVRRSLGGFRKLTDEFHRERNATVSQELQALQPTTVLADSLPHSPLEKLGYPGISPGVVLLDQGNSGTGRIRLRDCWIDRFCEFYVWDGRTIQIGNRVTINTGTIISGDVSIGNYSMVAPRCFLSSGTHEFRKAAASLIRVQDIRQKQDAAEGGESGSLPIVIEEDVWIGYGSVIQRGVTIGRGAIIGALSFVNKNVPPYSVYAGSPAREISRRLNFRPKDRIFATDELDLPYFYRGFFQMQEDLEAGRQVATILAGRESAVVMELRTGVLQLDLVSIGGRVVDIEVRAARTVLGNICLKDRCVFEWVLSEKIVRAESGILQDFLEVSLVVFSEAEDTNVPLIGVHSCRLM